MKKTLLLTTIFLLLLFSVQATYNETFDTDVWESNGNWQIYNSGGAYTVQNGVLNITDGATIHFVFNNSLGVGEYERVCMRISHNGACNTGARIGQGGLFEPNAVVANLQSASDGEVLKWTNDACNSGASMIKYLVGSQASSGSALDNWNKFCWVWNSTHITDYINDVQNDKTAIGSHYGAYYSGGWSYGGTQANYGNGFTFGYRSNAVSYAPVQIDYISFDTYSEATPTTNSTVSVQKIFEQDQETDVTLNSAVYTTIMSGNFTTNITNTSFYGEASIQITPSGTSTMACRIRINETDYTGDVTRTNTGTQKGSMHLTTGEVHLDNGSHTADVQCKKSSGSGTITISNSKGIGHYIDNGTTDLNHLFIDQTNTTSSSSYTLINTEPFTTSTNSTTGIEQNLIATFSATYTNNAGSTEELGFILGLGSTNCTAVTRTVTAGGTGSVSGGCVLQNVTNNTAYNVNTYAKGTSASFTADIQIIEHQASEETVNSTSIINNTGSGFIKIDDIAIENDIGTSNLYARIGAMVNGSGINTQFQIRLNGDSTANGTTYERYVNSNTGVVSLLEMFPNVATGNYTIEIWANMTDVGTIQGDLIAYVSTPETITAKTFIFNATDYNTRNNINTFSVYDSNGNKYSTTTGTITITQLGTQNLTYESTGYINSTYNNINTSDTSHTGILLNSSSLLTINIVGLWLNNILTGTELDITEGSITDDLNNPYTETLSNYLNYTINCTNLTVTAEDTNNYYQPNTTTLTLCYNDTTQNITLEPNKLVLAFTQNGASFNTDGYIVDLFNTNTSRAKLGFNETPLLVVQQDLSENRIIVQFNLFNSTNLVNGTQWYEYDNDYTTYINETLEILEDADEADSFYIQIRDYGEASIEDVVIRAYTADVPTATNYTELNFFGQRITNEEGRTYFIVPPNQYIRLDITKTGYETKRIEFNTLYDSNGQTDPMVVYLKEDVGNLFNSGIIYADSNEFYSWTDTIYVKVYKYGVSGDLVLKTDYTNSLNSSGIQGSRVYRSTQSEPMWGWTLTRGTHWTGDASFTVYIEDSAGNDLGNYTIAYAEGTRSDIFDADDVKDNIPNWAVFLLIIILSVIVGMTIQSPTAGTTTFFITTLFASFVKPIFLVLTVTVAVYYIGSYLREVYRE